MSAIQLTPGILALLLLLWIAYKIGKIVLRILAGLLFLGLIGYALWFFLLR